MLIKAKISNPPNSNKISTMHSKLVEIKFKDTLKSARIETGTKKSVTNVENRSLIPACASKVDLLLANKPTNFLV
jgi:hypothetical protein